jgi:hypothetical protein
MAGRRSDTWLAIRESARRQAEALVADCGWEDLPVAIAEIAARVGVRAVSFRRQSADGVLTARDDGGFDLTLHPLRGNWRELRREYLERGGRDLPGRMRFTVAHEIGHALMFAREEGVAPRQLFRPRTRREHFQVESECNRLAARLLMPEAVVQLARDDPRADPLEPERILKLGTAFAVSAEALLLRLGGVGWLSGRRAGVLLATGKEPRVKSWLPGSELACPGLEKGCPLRDLLPGEGLRPYGGDRADQVVGVPIAAEAARLTGGVVRQSIRVRSAPRGEIRRREWLVTFELVGEPVLTENPAGP